MCSDTSTGVMASQPQVETDASRSQKNTIELQAISLKESSRPRSAQTMTAVESSASGLICLLHARNSILRYSVYNRETAVFRLFLKFTSLNKNKTHRVGMFMDWLCGMHSLLQTTKSYAYTIEIRTNLQKDKGRQGKY